ncbi:Spermidine/putrescine import ATP-binding protein PotA [compost metagenome]
MRNAIKEIQNEVGITTVYVTHDQEEAMAVSDRIAVMKLGVIQHVGTPQEIYQRPANIFVATFIGRTNILEGTLTSQNNQTMLRLSSTYEETLPFPAPLDASLDAPLPVKVSVRPEEFIISEDGTGFGGTIVNSIFLGLNTHYYVDLATGQRVEITQESTTGAIMKPGTNVSLKVNKNKINVYDSQGEVNYTGGVQS